MVWYSIGMVRYGTAGWYGMVWDGIGMVWVGKVGKGRSWATNPPTPLSCLLPGTEVVGESPPAAGIAGVAAMTGSVPMGKKDDDSSVH